MPLVLEEFEVLTTPVSPNLPGSRPSGRTEVEKVAAYERGYQAGWDDAAQAEA